MSHRTRGVVASCLLVASPALAGCSSGAVEISGASLSDSNRAACEKFLADVPAVLAGEKAREVTPADAPGRAWGDPAITVTCGAAMPGGFDAFSQCAQANGVGWFVPLDQSDGSVDATFTAIGYEPRVALHVPSDYLPEGGAAALAQLAEAVRKDLDLVRPCT